MTSKEIVYHLLQVRIIPVQLQRLLTNLLLLDQQSASVDALTNSFGWSNNEVSGDPEWFI